MLDFTSTTSFSTKIFFTLNLPNSSILCIIKLSIFRSKTDSALLVNNLTLVADVDTPSQSANRLEQILVLDRASMNAYALIQVLEFTDHTLTGITLKMAPIDFAEDCSFPQVVVHTIEPTSGFLLSSARRKVEGCSFRIS